VKIEMDAEYDVLYIELRGGDVDRTVDLDDGVHMDLDAEDRVLGLEFLSLEAFRQFVRHHEGTVTIPELLTDPEALSQLRYSA
jgi:uncharacterized protein YuzE